MKLKINLSESREYRVQRGNFTKATVDHTNEAEPVEDIPVRGMGDESRLTGKVLGEDNRSYVAPKRSRAVVQLKKTDDEQQVGREQAVKAVEGKQGRIMTEDVFTYSSDESWQPKTEFERLFAPLGERLAAILRGDYPSRIVNRPSGAEATPVEDQQRAGVPATTMMASESRGKSPSAKMRSQMLKLVMPELSREQGEQLALAIKNHDGETVQRIFNQIGKKLNQVVSRKK
ncbi:hypothetical protein YOLOSWAG_214 [Erwinia phage vB_EamM_Yoloswag]|uniref:Uncharacterized protein n=1 Tax=Erwinia phage vB_EamM_Yoloswag TaxID=1958956 RepID=A0A1S6L3D8_9CAUD|nr:hypothetical protein HOR66_gp214 [Erwinia phage vB_EamM_Yoloswag]AQT28692.1 hypothetical protein YOLOSWAG_214 [Erwinia phage vB_EamM_Yoloswag]